MKPTNPECWHFCCGRKAILITFSTAQSCGTLTWHTDLTECLSARQATHHNRLIRSCRCQKLILLRDIEIEIEIVTLLSQKNPKVLLCDMVTLEELRKITARELQLASRRAAGPGSCVFYTILIYSNNLQSIIFILRCCKRLCYDVLLILNSWMILDNSQ